MLSQVGFINIRQCVYSLFTYRAIQWKLKAYIENSLGVIVWSKYMKNYFHIDLMLYNELNLLEKYAQTLNNSNDCIQFSSLVRILQYLQK